MVRRPVVRVQEAVHVNPSTVNFLSDQGIMQVTLVNDLPVPVEDISEEQRLNYMFASYNAGEGTLARAIRTAQAQQLHTPLMILHAGGVTPEGVTGSNSLEALEHSYENGFRLLELDFSWTCDGELVCVHDWNAFYGRILDTDSPTLAQFEAVRDSTYGFTSLTLDHLIAWLREHPGVSIVTDIKEDCAAGAALIAQRCPDLRSRFIIQIYHPEEYDQVADLGFEHIILTVYQMSWSEKQDTAALVRFAAEHPLEGITFPAELADTPGYVEALLEAQVPLFVHTVNDPADQAALVRQGISGIYTDLGAPAPQE